jgi:hypothetical protein
MPVETTESLPKILDPLRDLGLAGEDRTVEAPGDGPTVEPGNAAGAGVAVDRTVVGRIGQSPIEADPAVAPRLQRVGPTALAPSAPNSRVPAAASL